MPYEPSKFPDFKNLNDMADFMRREFELIAGSITVVVDHEYKVLHVAPKKPRDGVVAFADGTDWDPGSGEGLYVYYNSTWNKLG